MATKFQYSSDVGVPSYQNIEAWGRTSGIPFSVSSTTGGTHVNGSYHYKGNAEDQTSSAGNMAKLAAWYYQYYPYILELIHSGGGGFFVHNGQKVGASLYGASIVSQHYNHVHIAITNSGIQAARGAGGASGGNPANGTVSQPVASQAATASAVAQTPAGCGNSVATGLVLLAGLPLWVHHGIQLIGAIDGIIR